MMELDDIDVADNCVYLVTEAICAELNLHSPFSYEMEVYFSEEICDALAGVVEP